MILTNFLALSKSEGLNSPACSYVVQPPGCIIFLFWVFSWVRNLEKAFSISRSTTFISITTSKSLTAHHFGALCETVLYAQAVSLLLPVGLRGHTQVHHGKDSGVYTGYVTAARLIAIHQTQSAITQDFLGLGRQTKVFWKEGNILFHTLCQIS